MDRKQYPDTPEGARQLLKDDSILDIFGDEECIPDPGVEGVWKVILQPTYDSQDPSYGIDCVIVYLAGYKNPFGQVREENDFEVIHK